MAFILHFCRSRVRIPVHRVKLTTRSEAADDCCRVCASAETSFHARTTSLWGHTGLNERLSLSYAVLSFMWPAGYKPKKQGDAAHIYHLCRMPPEPVHLFLHPSGYNPELSGRHQGHSWQWFQCRLCRILRKPFGNLEMNREQWQWSIVKVIGRQPNCKLPIVSSFGTFGIRHWFKKGYKLLMKSM